MLPVCLLLHSRHMATFRLRHRHTARECPAAFAAWRGFRSPLRHHPTAGSCQLGGHELWWDVQAGSAEEALHLLPPFLAERTEVIPLSQVQIPLTGKRTGGDT